MSEEKTRIVPRSAPDDGDTITFKCENGHRINVPAKLAGKRGTCSKCGIPVVIPGPGPGPVVAPEPSAGEPAVPEVAPDVPVPAPVQAPSVPVAAPATADTFSHLFDTAGPAEQVIDVSAGLPEGASGVGSVVGDVLVRNAPEEFATPEDAAGAEHPTAQLVARLWLERNHGGKFELHLVGGGSPIMPEWYEARWSRGTHGLFANQAADGTVTLTAVAWESVQKIIVRQVEGLPDGMFE